MTTTKPTYSPTAVTYSLFPITYSLNYAFSAKERDTETGLSYFGARYYSSDLSIWLSVDPMSDKYPSLSPYVYCADNPVRCVDPNGEEFGDYFNMRGKYLGNDGNNDDNIYLIEKRSDIRKIKQNEKNHKTTNANMVNVKISTTKCEIWASEEVYDRTKENGGYQEEATSVFPNGLILDYVQGPDARYTEKQQAYLDLPSGYEGNGSGTLIHSHPLYEWGDICWPVSTKLDDNDKRESMKNAGFIIVGKTKPDTFDNRRAMAYFFKSDTFKGRISMHAVRKINKFYNGL